MENFWGWTAFVIIGGAFLGFCIPFYSYTTDDAYISFRYSRNLAHGLGLVYNAGEHVEGYTNFLWIVILAPFTLLPIPIEIVAKVLSILCSLGTLGIVYRFPRLLNLRAPSPLDLVAPVLVLMSAPFLLYTVAGLETAIFTFLILLGLYLLVLDLTRGRLRCYSALAFLLAAMTRPEGCLVWALAWGWLLSGRCETETARKFTSPL